MITDTFDSIQRKTELATRSPMEFLIMDAPQLQLVEDVFSPLYNRTIVDESVPSTRDFVGQEKRMLEEP